MILGNGYELSCPAGGYSSAVTGISCIYNATGSGAIYHAFGFACIILLFFCVAKRKVTKEKAIFGQRLRRPKNSSTLLSHCAIEPNARAFCVSTTMLLNFVNRMGFCSSIGLHQS